MLRARMNEPAGTFARVRADSALPSAARAARAQLDSLLSDAKKHPLRYVH